MKVYLYVTIFISLIGCVKFDKPQPIDTLSLNSIPSLYHGTWSKGNQKDSVVISRHYILMSETSIKKFTKEEVDTTENYQFTENKFYDFTNLDSYSGFPYELKNDTFYVKESKITKFDIGNRLHVSTIEDWLNLHLEIFGTEMNPNGYTNFQNGFEENDYKILWSTLFNGTNQSHFNLFETGSYSSTSSLQNWGQSSCHFVTSTPDGNNSLRRVNIIISNNYIDFELDVGGFGSGYNQIRCVKD